MAYNYEYPYTDPYRYNDDWILNRVKELSLEWIETRKEWNNTQEEFASLKAFIQNYFAELDLQDEVNVKLDIMARDGSLSALISPLFSEYKKEIDRSMSEQNRNISILEARMDAFTALSEGSTTGDAELIDGRVDYKGNTHANIGEHIREVSSQLSSEIDGMWYTIDLPLLTKRVLDSECKISLVSSEQYCVAFIENVSDYNKLKISASANYLNYCYCFFDENNEIVEKGDLGSGSDSVTQITNKEVSIPTNATLLIISSVNSIIEVKANNSKRLIDDKIENVTSIIGEKMEFIMYSDYKSGYYLPSGIETEISQTKYKVVTYNIEGYPFIYVSGLSNYSNYVYAIYDSDGNIIDYLKSNSKGDTSISNKKIYLTPNAKTIKVADIDYGSVKKNYVAIPSFDIITKKWSDKKWCCVGDSLTEINTTTTTRYFDYIKNVTGIEIINMGVSGSGYARHQDNGNAFYQRIDNVPIDIDVVTIFGSGNDGSAGLEIGSPSDSGTDTICGCINTTIDNLYKILPTVPLGIISPTPWSWQIPEDETCFMYRYSNALKAICEYRGIPFLDLFRLSAFRTMKDGAVSAEIHDLLFSNDPDGNCTHPNELGHKLIAPKIKAFLESLII